MTKGIGATQNKRLRPEKFLLKRFRTGVQLSSPPPEKSTRERAFFNDIRLRRVILLRSDIRLTPSDIALRAVRKANIISLFALAKNITFAARQTYHIERMRDISL